jgi:histidinol phosphatase-like enzyme (inositol monophosphatase family)
MDFTNFINFLADEAGQISLKYFRKAPDLAYKPDQTLVTQADVEIENRLRGLIGEYFPTHDIIGEEGENRLTEAEFCWIIDPIDGTTAFTAGKPSFTNLIGLTRHKKPILGVINQPFTKERWVGDGVEAFFNGVKIVKTHSKTGILQTTSPEFFKTESEKNIFKNIQKQYKTLSFGGDAYGYGLCALGFVDCVVETGLKIHDIAALMPILWGAGLKIYDFSEAEILNIDDFHGSVIVR